MLFCNTSSLYPAPLSSHMTSNLFSITIDYCAFSKVLWNEVIQSVLFFYSLSSVWLIYLIAYIDSPLLYCIHCILLYCWAVFHGVTTPKYICPFNCWRTSGLFWVLWKWNCYERSRTNFYMAICLSKYLGME